MLAQHTSELPGNPLFCYQNAMIPSVSHSQGFHMCSGNPNPAHPPCIILATEPPPFLIKIKKALHCDDVIYKYTYPGTHVSQWRLLDMVRRCSGRKTMDSWQRWAL